MTSARPSGPGVGTTVLRISTRMRALALVLLVAFDALMVWLAVFSLTKLATGPSPGLAVFVGVVALLMTWALWLLYRTRTVVTPDTVVLRYGFFPTVRVPRDRITGVEVRLVSYNGAGGGFVHTPYLSTADGDRRLVFMLGRRSEAAARREAANLRRLLGI
ncbi:hypothetical protein GCM10011594_41310 [Nakamurella endophytica]|uniref:Uncharacterized protein n=1 Tax=Nakamurella endophytica TaxID=1748367 RepID=A0A917TB29_9ACTN|nr:hypothetical protein GCM10011594_41310 [Nakamurella endophytica]